MIKKKEKRKGERREKGNKEKIEVRVAKNWKVNLKKLSCKCSKGAVITQRGQKKKKKMYLVKSKEEEFREINWAINLKLLIFFFFKESHRYLWIGHPIIDTNAVYWSELKHQLG